MPVQPLIIDHHFYHAKGHGKNSLASGVAHADYIANKKKAELLLDDRTTLGSAAIHAKYAEEREGSMGSFGTVSTEEAQRQIARHTQSPVYRLIIAVGEQDALAMDNGLTTRAGWEAAAWKAMPNALRAMGLDPSRVEWNAAAHRRQHGGQNNPHIHLLIWERGRPSRKKGVFNEKERRAIQKEFAKVLYQPELERIARRKTESRDVAKAVTRRALSGGLGLEMEQGMVHDLADRLAALADHLPPKGRLAYAYLPPGPKVQVMELAHWLSEAQPDLRAAKTDFLASAKEFASVYWSPPDSTDWGGPEQAAKRQAALDQAIAQADDDFHHRLTSDILHAAVALRTRKVDPGLWSEVQADAALRRQLRQRPEKAIVALQTLRPDLSVLRIQRQAILLRDAIARQSIRHRTRVTRVCIQSLLLGLRADDGRYQAYLSARERYQREKAEWDLAIAQGLDIAR